MSKRTLTIEAPFGALTGLGPFKAHCGSIAQYVGGARRDEGWCEHYLDVGGRDPREIAAAHESTRETWLGAAVGLLVLLNGDDA